MQVLERKDPVMQYSLDIECSGRGNGEKGCGSLLRIGWHDLRHFEEQEKMFNIVPEAVVFKCPVCNNTTDIPKKDWPLNHERLEKWSSAWRDGINDVGGQPYV